MYEGFLRYVLIAFRVQGTRNTGTVCRTVNVRHCYSTLSSGKQTSEKNYHKKMSSAFHCNSDVLFSSHVKFSSVKKVPTDEEIHDQTLDYLDSNNKDVYEILAKDMLVQKDFLSEEEENSLLNEVERYISRQRYEFDHWDNAIHGFRETEKKSWNDNNSKIIKRVQNMAFGTHVVPLPFVHVLDISKEGYIKPHVDAVRFCGDIIAGMCLLSSCVMRLALEKDSSKYGDVFLPRRCLYIMKGRARYEFTHEVLKEEASIFKNQTVPRDRRISIICRCEPNPSDTQ